MLSCADALPNSTGWRYNCKGLARANLHGHGGWCNKMGGLTKAVAQLSRNVIRVIIVWGALNAHSTSSLKVGLTIIRCHGGKESLSMHLLGAWRIARPESMRRWHRLRKVLVCDALEIQSVQILCFRVRRCQPATKYELNVNIALRTGGLSFLGDRISARSR